MPPNIKSIIVECHDAVNSARILQRDAFTLIQVNDTSSRIEPQPLERQPSVVILGLHSMSRMNFQRTMPKTAAFVTRMGWFEMQGYNKIADEIAPNLMAILSGESDKRCGPGSAGCTWIWKDYKRAGYATAIAEDNAGDAAFLQNTLGLADVAVDHDLRPLLLGIGRALSSYEKFGNSYCIGRRLAVSYVYDFCAQFTARFVQELQRPMFGFFWSGTMTNDSNFGASGLDAIFVDYMHKLEQQQLFEKSIVVLVSDHGARTGELMELPDGFLEERLPLLHIYLPPWFRSAYPNYAQALALNHDRLCSNFDLYNTLRHILQLNAKTPAMLPARTACPSSQSLLHPLPMDRSCEDACIGEHWCTCNKFVKQSLSGEMYVLGKHVVYYINRWMLVHHFNAVCQRLGLQDMDLAERKLLHEENAKEPMYGSIVIYRLRFRTYPDVGKFQATIRYNHELQIIEDLHVPDISRLNSYKNNSRCVSDKIAQKFCFCYPKAKLSGPMEDWQVVKLTTVSTF